MPISLISTVTAVGGNTSAAINTVGASLLVFVAAESADFGDAPSDSKGNNWTLVASLNDPSAFGEVKLYFCLNPRTSPQHTFSFASSSTFPSLAVTAWSGIGAYQGIFNKNTTTTNILQPGTVTSDNAESLFIVGWELSAGNITTVNDGFSIACQNTFGHLVNYASGQAYLLQNFISSFNPQLTLSTSASSAGVIAVFSAQSPPAISAFLVRKLHQPRSVLPIFRQLHKKNFPIFSPSLKDQISTSDNYSILAIFPFSLSNTAVSSDSFSGGLEGGLNDSGNSNDKLSSVLTFNQTLADFSKTIDGFATPLLKLAALGRKAVVSGAETAPLAFAGLLRKTLISAGNSSTVKVAFAGIFRKTLALIYPPLIPGPIPIFPTLPEGFPVKITPSLDTTIGTLKSLREMRVAQRTYPVWDIEILFEELKDETQNQTPYAPFTGYAQYQELVQTWLMMYGQAGVFAFDCPWDDSREDQPIGTGDGRTYTFTIYRTWGLLDQATVAPVGLVNQVINVKINGTIISDETYYINRNTIVFIGPNGQYYTPDPGAQITMTFSYYYLCRWTEDQQDFVEFAKNRWNVQSLKFRASPW